MIFLRCVPFFSVLPVLPYKIRTLIKCKQAEDDQNTKRQSYQNTKRQSYQNEKNKTKNENIHSERVPPNYESFRALELRYECP